MTTATLPSRAGSAPRAVVVVLVVLVLLGGGIALVFRAAPDATVTPPQTAPVAGADGWQRYQHYYSGQLSGGSAVPRYQHYYGGQQLSGAGADQPAFSAGRGRRASAD